MSNPDRPELRPHIARIWPYEGAAESTIFVAPTLAYNIGLALHLTPLLDSTTLHDEEVDAEEEESSTAADALSQNHSYISVIPFIETHIAPSISGNKSSSTESTTTTTTTTSEEAEKGGARGVGGEEFATLPQPSPLEPARVPIAVEMHVSVVREPTGGWLPPSEDAHPGQSFLDSGGGGGDVVQLIQSYFIGGTKVVCEGDILAVLKGDSSSIVASSGSGSGSFSSASVAAAVLENLSLPVLAAPQTDPSSSSSPLSTEEESQWNFSEYLFFRIMRVLPAGKAIQAIDVETTQVKLVGSCSNSLPVGLRGYLAPRAPPTSLLGWHAAAATLPSGWKLPFVGEVLPTWRLVAQLAATMLHPASTGISLRLAMLLHGPTGSGKRTAAVAAAAALGCHIACINCRDIQSEGPLPDGKVAEGLRVAFDVAGRYRPAFLVLEDFQLLAPGGDVQAEAAAARLGAALTDCIATAANKFHNQQQMFPSPVVLIACATDPDDVPSALRRCFTHEIAVAAPDVGGRESLLRSFMGGAGVGLDDDDWADMARHTAGLLPRDLKSFAADACAAAAVGVLSPSTTTTPVLDTLLLVNGGGDNDDDNDNDSEVTGVNDTLPIVAPPLGDLHISAALNNARERMATDIGAPKIPNVLWDDVGGLEDVKSSILDTVELPLKYPELFSGGLRRRSGVLLYGPPGTGKTLLAKAVATECAVNFLSVKGPELINMYVGESERQIREVFARARRARPCVIFFDELDSLAPARGRGSDSGGVMDRVVSQLLAEIDSAQGGSGTDDVFIIGATNRPDLLDPALLRPGRLDKLLYVGVASDAASQLKVIKALTRKFEMHSDVDLSSVAAGCPPRLTGADLYALCSDAWMIALKRHVAAAEEPEVNDGSGTGGGVVVVVVQQIDFEIALQSLRPSLHEEDIAHYEAIRDQYAGK